MNLDWVFGFGGSGGGFGGRSWFLIFIVVFPIIIPIVRIILWLFSRLGSENSPRVESGPDWRNVLSLPGSESLNNGSLNEGSNWSHWSHGCRSNSLDNWSSLNDGSVRCGCNSLNNWSDSLDDRC